MIKYFCDDCERQFKPEELKPKILNGKKQYFCSHCIDYQDIIVKLKEEHPGELYCTSTFFNPRIMSKLCNTIHGKYGLPIIYCSPSFETNMTNITYESVTEDIKKYGYVGRMYGFKVFVSPQVDRDTAYIIPFSKEQTNDLQQGIIKPIPLDTIPIKGEYHVVSLR